MKEFRLDGREFVELCDLLKIMDLTQSGAEAKHCIADGKVKVNETVELRKRCKIRSGQVIEFKNQKIKVI
ncbi:MAG: RNA-binding S4 domain-containing protein [Bacteriovoracaceae bacterium]